MRPSPSGDASQLLRLMCLPMREMCVTEQRYQAVGAGRVSRSLPSAEVLRGTTSVLVVRRRDQKIVGHPAFALQMPPDLAVGVDRRAVDIDRGVIGHAASDSTLRAGRVSHIGAAAADPDRVLRSWNVARRLRAGRVDEMPGRGILKEVDP